MKNTLAFIILCLFSFSSQAEPIQIADDLEKDAQVSRTENKPIVFFVTADHCPYCEQLRQDYLKFSPSDERFILREIELDEFHSLVGFKGEIMSHQLLADQYNISLTPTVAFVGPDGTELADSIVGVLTMDFYHYYFEKALDQSISKLRENKLAQQP